MYYLFLFTVPISAEKKTKHFVHFLERCVDGASIDHYISLNFLTSLCNALMGLGKLQIKTFFLTGNLLLSSKN
uniref:Uncharacterized protein n=1 Tax=Solanum tuberosum TaxID=4113 RepID=M1BGH9_SOLTU